MTSIGLFTRRRSSRSSARDSIGPIRFVILPFVVFVLVFDFLLRRSTAFRRIFYTGSNTLKAAAYSGIRTQRVILATTVLCSTLASWRRSASSLMGMIVRNSVILVDQIEADVTRGSRGDGRSWRRRCGGRGRWC